MCPYTRWRLPTLGAARGTHKKIRRTREKNTDTDTQEDAEEDANRRLPWERTRRRHGQPHGEAMRQNNALAAELWHEASQIQGAITLVLEASGGATPTGMITEVVTGIRNVFQRIWRRARIRGWMTGICTQWIALSWNQQPYMFGDFDKFRKKFLWRPGNVSKNLKSDVLLTPGGCL